jgi:hypothetical protein
VSDEQIVDQPEEERPVAEEQAAMPADEPVAVDEPQ